MCNICGMSANSFITLQIAEGDSTNYPVMPDKDGNLIFYVCKTHEYMFDKMSANATDIKALFKETLELYK